MLKEKIAQQPKAVHVTSILQALHWLQVEQRIVFEVLLLNDKAINNIAPYKHLYKSTFSSL